MMNPHRDPSLHKEPLRLYQLLHCTVCWEEKEYMIQRDDADITNCCDQGSAIIQPLFPRPFLSEPKAKGRSIAAYEKDCQGNSV